jgi:hypothetical protein
MPAWFKAHGASAFGLAFAVSLFGIWLGQPAYGQADQGTRTVISGTVLALNGQPVAGVLIGYFTAEEIMVSRGRLLPRMVPPNGRRQLSEDEQPAIAVTGTRIRREGYATETATRRITAEEISTSEETITSEDMQLLGLVDRVWLIHPSGIAFVDGKPVGETDATGAFRVELPGGGTYVITARSESVNSRGYGSRQPVVVETGQMLQLAPIMLSLTTDAGCCAGAPPTQ